MTPHLLPSSARGLALALPLSGLLFLSACGDDPASNQQVIGNANTPDSGAAVVDAGLQPPPSSVGTLDAASPTDAGALKPDTGAVALLDAGMTLVDG